MRPQFQNPRAPRKYFCVPQKRETSFGSRRQAVPRAYYEVRMIHAT